MPPIICRPPVEHVEGLWPRVEPEVRRALRHANGCYEPADILAALLAGKMQLWLAWRDGVVAAMVTELLVYPRRKSCRVFLIGGREMASWRAAFERELAAFARAEKCDFLEGGGRRGWVRAAGYRNAGAILIKELEHG